MTGSDEAKTKLYEDLHALLATAAKAERQVGLSDFSARAGTDRLAWRRVLGPHGVAGCNDSEFILLRTYAEYRIILTNAFIRLSIRKTATWIHPPIAALDVVVTKSISEVGGWTDHRSIISKCHLRDVVHSTAVNVLSHTCRQQQNWFDDNAAGISNLLAWIARRVEEIQGYRNEMKDFFVAIGTPKKGTASILSYDGSTLLTEKSQILKRWVEHFGSLLNLYSAIPEATIDQLPKVDHLPSLPEAPHALQQLSSAKPRVRMRFQPKFTSTAATGNGSSHGTLINVSTGPGPSGLQGYDHHPSLRAQREPATLW
ncbi:hypothetical protein SprV_0301211100 [Sparganum proliferum]